ncbi:MAG: YxeA family protein [Solibacillus sp.]
MKKLFITLGALVAILIAALVVFATVDFNRMGKDHVYVQITTDGEVETYTDNNGAVYKTYWYELPAYTADGEEQTVKFSAQKGLRQDAYLMLYMKNGNEVTSYDEVQFEELPAKVQEKLQ